MQPDKAREVLRRMQKKGVEPNVLSYSALVDGHAVAGRVDEAADWLKTAADEGVTPNVVTFSSVAKGMPPLGGWTRRGRYYGTWRRMACGQTR